MANMSCSGNLANLVATIDSVAVGESCHDEDVEETQLVTAEMLEGTVLHLADGQAINVVQMSASLEDAINVVQVETTDLGDHVTSLEEICSMDIDSEEQKHILSETGAHVIVKTENEEPMMSANSIMGRDHVYTSEEKPPIVLPTIPFSFPGQTFDTKCQKLILNVWDFFRRVKKNPDLLDEIRTPQERAAAALHISAATIGKIGKNFKRTGKLETPGKKRKRTKPVVDSVNSEQEEIIRKIIKEFKDSRITPTLPLILNECRERINFQGGATSFRRILQRMGFKGLSNKAVGSISTKTKPVVPSSVPASGSSKMSPSTISHSGKVIKKEPQYISIPIPSTYIDTQPSPSKKLAFRSVITPHSSEIVSSSKQQSLSNFTKQSSRLLFGDNVIHLGTNAKGEPITISSQTAAAIASATARAGESSQTIHVVQSDNTLQQIQIVYANL